MSRTVTVVTPENIQITYPLAGFASRFMAFLVDLLIQIGLVLLVQMILTRIVGLSNVAGLSAGSLVSAVGILVVYLLIFAYAILFEMLWGGRTPGKRLFGLRVVRDGGYPIHLPASALRNVLRFLDFGLIPLSAMPLILFGLPGIVCIFFSPTYKRIGDYAAGTLVIVERGASSLGTRRNSRALSPGATALLPFVKNLDRLTTEEYRLVRLFAARRDELDAAVRPAVAQRIALPLMQKLGMALPGLPPDRYADLLEALERRYAEERGIL